MKNDTNCYYFCSHKYDKLPPMGGNQTVNKLKTHLSTVPFKKI